MKAKIANDKLPLTRNVAVDDGSEAFDNFIIDRLEMAKDRDNLISIEELFSNMRLKADSANV